MGQAKEKKGKPIWQSPVFGFLLFGIGLVLLLIDFELQAGRFEGRNGKVEFTAIVYESMSKDGSRIAVNDNYERVYCLDEKTQDVIYTIDFHDVPLEENFFIEDVFFDENNRLYTYMVEQNDSWECVLRESFCVFDETGKFQQKYIWKENSEEERVTRESLAGCVVAGDELQYLVYDGNEIVYETMDLHTEKRTTKNVYTGWSYQRLVWANPNEDGSFAITWSDGEIGMLDEYGYESVAQVRYDANEYKEGNVLPGMVVAAGDDFYVLDKSLSADVYHYRDGVWEKYADVKGLCELDADMPLDEYVSYCIDYPMYNIKMEGDCLVICMADQLFFLKDGQVVNTISGAHKMPALHALVAWYKQLAKGVAIGLLILGGILIVGSLMKWRLSLTSRLVLSIVGVVVVVGILTIRAILFQAERGFYENIYEEYAAVSEMALLQLNPNMIDQMDDLRCVKYGLDQKLQTDIEEIFNKVNYDWNDDMIITIYDYQEDGINHLIAGTESMNGIFDSIYYITRESLQEERYENTNTYMTTSHTTSSRYITALTEIRNAKGEIVGWLDISSEQNDLAKALQSIQNAMAYRFVVMMILLGIVVGLFVMYINRSLNRTSKMIAQISEGNLKVRIDKISKDSLGTISKGVNRMAEQIQRMLEEKDTLTLHMVEMLVSTIDAKDSYTNGHSLRVAKYSREIARRLGKSREEQMKIYYAGLLHDIGKIGISDAIINKTTRLTDEEFAEIQTHPGIGYEILSKMSDFEGLAVGAIGHHERYDGRGYPNHLKGEEIPEMARIIGVADAYDAMTSNRSYRNALTQERVRGELEKGKNTQFDARFAELMLEIDLENTGIYNVQTKGQPISE